MADIPVYAGSSSFFPGDTAFGFYDYQYDFQVDADAVVTFALGPSGSSELMYLASMM